jgi:uncharacterized SAM-binding protein YcdF (DUF218 family)
MFLMKLLPEMIYPVGLVCLFILLAMLLRKRRGWQMACLVLGLALLWLGGNEWVTGLLLRSLEWQYLPPAELPEADVILVLEGATRPAEYPRSTVEIGTNGARMLHAVWLYQQGKAPLILHSGGGVPWLREPTDDAAKAEALAGLWHLLGIPEEAVLVEVTSQTTHEAALVTKPMLEEHGLGRVLLVTSAAHMPRAVAVFEHEGIAVIPAPADYAVSQAGWQRLWRPDWRAQVYNLVPRAGNLSATTAALKEYIGLLTYKVLGWA